MSGRLPRCPSQNWAVSILWGYSAVRPVLSTAARVRGPSKTERVGVRNGATQVAATVRRLVGKLVAPIRPVWKVQPTRLGRRNAGERLNTGVRM